MGCSASPTKYENTTENIPISQAPADFKKVKIALIHFQNLTGRSYLTEPATAQLTTFLIRSGYFEVIEPSLVTSIIRDQKDITQEKLNQLKEKFGARYFLTGNLTNFEIKEAKSGFCLLFGLLGGHRKREYIVESGIDFRLVSVPEAKIIIADKVENRRTDTSQAGYFLFSSAGSSVQILQSSGGKLLRYALKDVTEKIIKKIQRL